MKHRDYQIEVMSLIGYAVLQLQHVELAISYCWMLYARREKQPVDSFVFEGDFDNLKQRNVKKMLGRFLVDIGSSGQFKVSFYKRFQRFVDNRNRLVHRIFKERAYRNLRKKDALERLRGFTSRVLRDAFYFECVFDAYLGMSLELLAQQPGYEVGNAGVLKALMDEKRRRGDLKLLFSAIKKGKGSFYFVPSR